MTGSGKTTLARHLAGVTGLPLFCVDDLTWRPGWTPVPEDEQRHRIEEICARDRWVLDSAYSTWLDVALARAQLVVALDYPRWLSLSRLAGRTAARILDRRPICNGNYETLRTAFSRDSILLWHFRTFGSKRARMRAWSAHPTEFAVLRFRRPRQAAAWLVALRGGTPRSEAAEAASREPRSGSGHRR